MFKLSMLQISISYCNRSSHVDRCIGLRFYYTANFIYKIDHINYATDALLYIPALNEISKTNVLHEIL